MASPTPLRSSIALLQLASPMLPIGAFAYSQGLERAVEDGLVRDATTASRWIGDLLAGPIARFELPVLVRLHRAAVGTDADAFQQWNTRYYTSRESAELRAETLQMGSSLAILARDLALGSAVACLSPLSRPTHAAAFAAVAVASGLDAREAALGFGWGWLENQVAAALKAVPLGQVAGQRMLSSLRGSLERAVDAAQSLPDDALVSAAPGLALTCALHETQYSRLFRS